MGPHESTETPVQYISEVLICGVGVAEGESACSSLLDCRLT